MGTTDVVSSVRVEVAGSHERVRVWNRGGLAGELVVKCGDGGEIERRLIGDGQAWGKAGGAKEGMQTSAAAPIDLCTECSQPLVSRQYLTDEQAAMRCQPWGTCKRARYAKAKAAPIDTLADDARRALEREAAKVTPTDLPPLPVGVDLAKARAAAMRLIDYAFDRSKPRPRFCIPRRKDDDDAILLDALDELGTVRGLYPIVVRAAASAFSEGVRAGESMKAQQLDRPATREESAAALGAPDPTDTVSDVPPDEPEERRTSTVNRYGNTVKVSGYDPRTDCTGGCGRKALDDKATCGELACKGAHAFKGMQDAFAKVGIAAGLTTDGPRVDNSLRARANRLLEREPPTPDAELLRFFIGMVTDVAQASGITVVAYTPPKAPEMLPTSALVALRADVTTLQAQVKSLQMAQPRRLVDDPREREREAFFAVLVQRLGGSVVIQPNEVADAMKLTLSWPDDFRDGRHFKVSK